MNVVSSLAKQTPGKKDKQINNEKKNIDIKSKLEKFRPNLVDMIEKSSKKHLYDAQFEG